MPATRPASRPDGPGRSRGATLALAGVLGLAAILLLIVFVVRTSSSEGRSNLGDPIAEYNAADLARRIERDGGAPVLLPDLLGRGRSIYVGHEGADPKVGWVGFRAVAPGADDRCILAWDRAQGFLGDPTCGSGARYDRLGRGLTPVVVYVTGDNRNKLVVDLRPEATLPSTTAAP